MEEKKQMEEKNMRTEETKHEVTNEQILEHLKEIVLACITDRMADISGMNEK